VDGESHAERSARRVDFAYTVIDTATGDVVGCVHLKPSRTGGDEVEALSWVCAARADLDGPLTAVVGAWLAQRWPVTVVRYRSGDRPVVIRRNWSDPAVPAIRRRAPRSRARWSIRP
jgi:hypothetical protein